MRKVLERMDKSEQSRKEAAALRMRTINLLTDEVAQFIASSKVPVGTGEDLSATEVADLEDRTEPSEPAQSRAEDTITALRGANATISSKLAKALRDYRYLEKSYDDFKYHALLKQRLLASSEEVLQVKNKKLAKEKARLLKRSNKLEEELSASTDLIKTTQEGFAKLLEHFQNFKASIDQRVEKEKEEGIRDYRKAVLEALPGADLSEVDKKFPDIFKG